MFRKLNGTLIILFAIIIYSFKISFVFAEKLENADEKLTKKGFVYESHNKFDPFISYFDRQRQQGKDARFIGDQTKQLLEKIQKLKINGILWGEKTPLVMINSKIYKKNDVIEDLKIENIEENSVFFNYKGMIQEINIIKKMKLDSHGGQGEKNN